MSLFNAGLVDQLNSLWVSAVSLWRKPNPELSSKIKRAQN
jgi:hypothetical protein